MGDVVQLLRLVLVDVDGVLVQNVFDGIRPQFVVGIEFVKMAQSLGPASQVVINLELASGVGKLLELTQEREIFARILDTKSGTWVCVDWEIVLPAGLAEQPAR